jgi:dCMP deaminase
MPPSKVKNRFFDSQTAADQFYLSEALSERANTDDPKGKIVLQSAVGAVIVKDNELLARSANVLPPALKIHMGLTGASINDESRYHLIEHAERSAIFKAMNAGTHIQGGTIYCTRFPCSDCARAIVWAGLSRAVFGGGFGGEKHWQASQRAALKILRDSGVRVRYLNVTGPSSSALE